MDDQTLRQAFSAASLTHAAWMHETHVRTAFLFSQRYLLDAAHLGLRSGIIRLDEVR